MNALKTTCLLALTMVLISVPAIADSPVTRIQSIPHALSTDNIYKLRIDRIDGQAAPNRLYHELPPGDHELTLTLMLDIQWDPAPEGAKPGLPSKSWTLTIPTGASSLQIAARVNPEAREEQQLANEYWQPFVYSSEAEREERD